VRTVTFNIHAGVDGYGRATDALEGLMSLAPELLFVQELWRGDEVDQYSILETRLNLRGAYVPLGEGERVTAQPGGRGWQHPLALLHGEEGLFFEGYRELTPRQIARLEVANGREVGSWGVALLTSCEIVSLETRPLTQLRRDKVRRALIIARLRHDGHDFYAVALHGAHLSHGSLWQYREVARHLDVLSDELPTVVGGDFNCWRPLLRTVLRGWRSGVRARTWPAWRPHSQIDHFLLRGPWRVTNARSFNGSSDHRALVMDATLD